MKYKELLKKLIGSPKIRHGKGSHVIINGIVLSKNRVDKKDITRLKKKGTI